MKRSKLFSALLLMAASFISIESMNNLANAQQSKKEPTSAQMKEYVEANSIVLCRALKLKVSFDKSVNIAAGTLAEILLFKHDGNIPELGKLKPEGVFKGAASVLVMNAYQICPNDLPAEVKSKLKKEIEKRKNK